MKEPVFRSAISHAWHFLWKHPLLWPLGLFASFLGHMGLAELLTNITVSSTQATWQPAWWLSFTKMGEVNMSLSSGKAFIGTTEAWVWLGWVVIVLIAIGLLFLFVAVVSQGAIIHTVAQSLSGRRKKYLDYGKAWHAGVGHFWKLLSVNAIKKVILWLLGAAVGFATINVVLGGSAADMWLFFFVFLLAALVGIFLSFLVVYAAGYIVVEEYSVGRAIHAAWRLFFDHWLVSIEAALVVLFGYFVLFILAAVGMFILFLPSILIWLIAATISSYLLFSIGLILGTIIFGIYIIFLGSLFTVFTTTVWTDLFMRMHKKGLKSRVLVWMGK